jgi:hypothetical protein
MAEVPAALRTFAGRLKVKAATNQDAATLLRSIEALMLVIERDDHPSAAIMLADQAIAKAATEARRGIGGRKLRTITDDPDNVEYRRKHPHAAANQVATDFAPTAPVKYGIKSSRQIWDYVNRAIKSGW